MPPEVPADQPPYGDDPWTQLKHAVASGGSHVCEFNKCPSCGSIEVDVHPFVESLKCSQCGNRYHSTDRRSCSFRNAIIHKMQEVVQQVKDWYPAEVFGGSQELDSDDLSKLDPKTRAIVQRKCVHMARVVCSNILAEFDRLTEYELEVADESSAANLDEDEEEDVSGSEPASG
jgi:hypothetical protein